MNTSESIAKIAPALLKAQKAMTFAVKDSKNPHFKSTYADLGSVIDACKPALNEAGIAFMQMPAPSDPGTIALTTRLMHESGEWIESTATCPLPKNDPQGYGSANTYLRRYALAAAVGLYQDDDDGNAASKPQPVVAQSFRSSGTMGVFETLAPKRQSVVIDTVNAIRERMSTDDVMGAYELAASLTDGEEKTALWGKLDAKTRAAIKAISAKETA
jgi:hypothetical protein